MTNTGAVLEAGLTQAVSPRGHLSNAPTFRLGDAAELGNHRIQLSRRERDSGDIEGRRRRCREPIHHVEGYG